MAQRRIVVGLDPRTRERELEAAAAFAGQLGAELAGLFIEDVDLLRFAALPFAHEIGVASAARLKLDVDALERSMRGFAVAAARMLESTAGQVAIPWSFRVVRGDTTRELLRAAAEALAGDARDELRLLLLGDGDSPATRWAEAARATLAAQEAARRLQIVHSADLSALERALREGEPAVVVLQGKESVLAQQGLAAVLRESGIPVIIVPGRGAGR
jgi:nucleotide-binding universal stress UspA family protein